MNPRYSICKNCREVYVPSSQIKGKGYCNNCKLDLGIANVYKRKRGLVKK